MDGHPDAELVLNEELVRRLLAEQCPEFASERLRLIGQGWDNAMFRLGDSLSVRLPRRVAAAQLIRHEQTCLPQLADRLPVPIPVPVHCGVPSSCYPWPWSVLPWFDGICVDEHPLSHQAVNTIVEFLQTLHQVAPATAPTNESRGIPLIRKWLAVEERLNWLRRETSLISPSIEQLWQQGREAPETQQRCWLHGDLHAQNVLAADGMPVAIIDWGDITAGDVATDLACTWALFDDQTHRQQLLECYGTDDATVARAKAWAVSFAVLLCATGLVNNPRHARQGQAIFTRLEADSNIWRL